MSIRESVVAAGEPPDIGDPSDPGSRAAPRVDPEPPEASFVAGGTSGPDVSDSAGPVGAEACHGGPDTAGEGADVADPLSIPGTGPVIGADRMSARSTSGRDDRGGDDAADGLASGSVPQEGLPSDSGDSGPVDRGGAGRADAADRPPGDPARVSGVETDAAVRDEHRVGAMVDESAAPSSEPNSTTVPARTGDRSGDHDVDPLEDAYRAACARYTRAVRAAQQSRSTAEHRYRAEVDGVRAVAQRAVAEREAAARSAVDANRMVAQTDDTAVELWRRLSTYVGDKRLGPTPPPDDTVTATGAAAVTAALKRTRMALATVQRGELPFGPPRHAVGIAAAVGAGCGLVAGAVAMLLLGVDGDDSTRAVWRAAGLVVLFLGCIAGIPVVGSWLSVRHRVGLGAGHIAATVGAAVVTVAVLSPLLMTA